MPFSYFIISAFLCLFLSACVPDGEKESSQVDSDADGVSDGLDFYPNDPERAHKITVSIVGLKGAIYLNFGLENRVLNEDSVFEFGVESGALVTITISDKPEAQNCEISDASFLAVSNNYNIEVKCSDRQLLSDALNQLPDENFKSCLSEKEYLYSDQVIAVSCSYKEIENVEGLEQFPLIRHLYLEGNDVSIIDLKGLLNLYTLFIGSNNLVGLDVTSNLKLTNLRAPENKLVDIDLSNNLKLKSLWLVDNKITAIDLSNNVDLKSVNISENSLTSLNLMNNPELSYITLTGNDITRIDLSSNSKLKYIWLDDNELTDIKLEYKPELIHLWLSNNHLTNVDVSELPALQHLYIENNELVELDMVNQASLTRIYAGFNNLTSVNVLSNENLELLELNNNFLNDLNLANNILLRDLDLSYNQLNSIDLSENTELRVLLLNYSELIVLNVSNQTKLGYLDAKGNYFKEVPIGILNIEYLYAPIDLRNNLFTQDALDELSILSNLYHNIFY
ncbi:MAG: leucine-rich repeat domain-containing protein [Bermanella sp.]